MISPFNLILAQIKEEDPELFKEIKEIIDERLKNESSACRLNKSSEHKESKNE